jgi:hypothetical protein
LDFHVRQHDKAMPNAAFEGQAPDEMQFGDGDVVACAAMIGAFSGCGASDEIATSAVVSESTSGLSPDTTYFWKVSASDRVNTTYSETRIFSTE